MSVDILRECSPGPELVASAEPTSVDAVQLEPPDTEKDSSVPSTAVHDSIETGVSREHRVNRRASLPSILHRDSHPTKVVDPRAVGPVTLEQMVRRRHSSIVTMQATTPRVEPAPVQVSSDFHATFGSLGVLMVIAFVASAITLYCMAFVQVFPTPIANFLMKTSDLDHGDLWLLTEPPPVLVVLSTLMLVVFGCSYVALAYVMVFSRKRLFLYITRKPTSGTHSAGANRQPVSIQSGSHFHEVLRTFLSTIQHTLSAGKASHRVGSRSQTQGQSTLRSSFMHEFTSLDGVYHAYYSALFDLPKLVFQTAALGTYLTEGFPLPIIYFYLSMLMTNWLVSFYRFQRHTPDPELIVTRLFYLFDLFFAVFAPIFVLAYAYAHFVLDRGIFDIRDRTLSPGSFDRIARLFADPVQVDVFRYGFQHLQLTKTWYVTGKCCLNTLVVYKWKKIIVYLVMRHHANGQHEQAQGGAAVSPRKSLPLDNPKQRDAWRVMVRRAVRVHGKRRHLVFGIIVFLTSMAAIPTYVSVSITSSLKSCTAISQCRVVSYRWLIGDDRDYCPCVVFIDRDQAPRTFDAWINAPDATQPLALAARSGHLKTVQIVNRALQELPIELRTATELEQLILVYTKTQLLPEWVSQFHNLHYIHIESDFIHSPLHTLPFDMFAHTPKLRFIRFGGAAKLRAFPSLRGLHELSTLVLSIPRGLDVIPDFTGLDNLKTLIIADATHARSLPSLQPLKALTTFSLFRRNAMCCNGFITGTCDLTSYQCVSRANEDPVTCEASRLPQEDRELLDRIGGFVCSTNLTSDVADSEPTVYSTDTLCGGVRYKQCELGGRSGMCYNGRMQVIHCDVFGEYEAMRRLEIAEGVGPVCDPEVEAWLGCGL